MLLKSFTIYRYLESPKTAKNLEKQKKQSQKSWGCLGNQKNKKKTLRRIVGLTQKIVFFGGVFPRLFLFFLVSNAKNQKKLEFFGCFHTYYQPIPQKKQKKTQVVWIFDTFQCRKPNLKC